MLTVHELNVTNLCATFAYTLYDLALQESEGSFPYHSVTDYAGPIKNQN